MHHAPPRKSSVLGQQFTAYNSQDARRPPSHSYERWGVPGVLGPESPRAAHLGAPGALQHLLVCQESRCLKSIKERRLPRPQLLDSRRWNPPQTRRPDNGEGRPPAILLSHPPPRLAASSLSWPNAGWWENAKLHKLHAPPPLPKTPDKNPCPFLIGEPAIFEARALALLPVPGIVKTFPLPLKTLFSLFGLASGSETELSVTNLATQMGPVGGLH
ncbi:uncharacterized protein LOC124232253 [Equus quagga]|uniref:uncharacterized protein LOC124232253 n=1 Tax=Equus quagga TaxID=89248 RepID=UPI001EE1595E|nr:uncharacterized protein LOC124232253 [Equus quagga]